MTEQVGVSDEIGVKVMKAKKPFVIRTQNIKTFSADTIIVDAKENDENKTKSEYDSSSQDKTPQDSEP